MLHAEPPSSLNTVSVFPKGSWLQFCQVPDSLLCKRLMGENEIQMMQSTSKQPIWGDLVNTAQVWWERVRVKEKNRLIWWIVTFLQRKWEESSKVLFPVWDVKSKSVLKKRQFIFNCSSSLNGIINAKLFRVTWKLTKFRLVGHKKNKCNLISFLYLNPGHSS